MIADFAALSGAGTLLAPGFVNAMIDATLKLVAPVTTTCGQAATLAAPSNG